VVFSVEATDAWVRGFERRGWFDQWGAGTRWTRVGRAIVVAGSEEGATMGVSAIMGAAAVNSTRVSSWSWLIWARILSSFVGSVGDSVVELLCQSDGPTYNVVQCDSETLRNYYLGGAYH
jgi:hypothetical protein